MLTFALELKTLAIVPFIIGSLMPVAQRTAELIAVSRFKQEKCTESEEHIDVTRCLELMHLAAQASMSTVDHTINFWRLMRLDFVLMILSPHQPLRDFDIMLQLLAMSTMKDSIGPQAVDQDTQSEIARYIIDRISLPLVAQPTVKAEQKKHDTNVIAALRMQILRTFEAFCQHPWGGEAVALHLHAIGRIVKIMSNELDTLYNYRAGHKQR